MPRKLVFACFFVSGSAGLVYEIAWIRRASLVFGATTPALSTVLAVFFGGLALGAWLCGRLALRTERPIRWYAALEFGVAASALATPALFGVVDDLYGAAWRGALAVTTDRDGLTWLAAGPGLALVRGLLVALVLLVPTTLMGATLPLFVRQFTVSRERLGRSVGFLYGLNTLGAAAGTLTAGLLLLPAVGVTGAIGIAAGLNVLAGALSLAVPLRVETPTAGDRDSGPAAVASTPPALRRALPALFFAAGFTAVGAEVLWSRFLALVIRNSVITYTLTLAVVLLGIVIGSWLASRLADRRRLAGIDRAAWYGLLQLCAGAVLAVSLFLPVGWWRALGEGLAPIVLLMLPGAVASGALFPLANRLVLEDPATSAAGVGRMTALNTVGGILGSLAVGFAVLPHLGLDAGVRLLAGGALAAGATALWLAGGRLPLRVGAVAIAAAAAYGLPAMTGLRLPDAHLAPAGQLVAVAEGTGATLAAVRTEDRLQLQIDRLWQGSDRKNHQVMAAHVPALLHGAPRDVLVIGVGVGQTAGRFLMHGVERLDCVDIEPAIFPFVDRHFPAAWMRDPRVTLAPEDGRTFTAHTDRRYDIVSVEVGQVFRPGVDVFYTREFYREAAALLRPGGLVAQFVSLAFFGEAEFASVVGTFLEEFPHAVLWYNTQELLLIGSAEAPLRLDPARLGPEALPAAVAADLAWSHWGGTGYRLVRPGALLGGFLAAGEQLHALAEGGAVYRDNRPALAYATADVQAWEHREAPLAARLVRSLSPFALVVGDTAALDPRTLELARRTRQLNLQDLVADGFLDDAVAGVVSGTGEPATSRQVLAQLEQVVRTNPENFHGWYNAGKALLLNGQPGAATEPLARAVSLRPDDGLARRDLGLALLQTDRAAEALPHLEAAAGLRPDDPSAHNYLGAALGATGDPAGAVRAFERSLALAPGDAAVRQNLERARRLLAGGER